MSPTVSLPALLLLVAAANADVNVFNTSLVTASLVVKNFSTFAIFTFPPCKYTGKVAHLTITGNASFTTISNIFTVPDCRMRRDVLTVVDQIGGATVTKNIGYRVTGLSPNSNYRASYNMESDSSTTLLFTTADVTNYTSIPLTMARSGGMVVITVLLSIAMAILLISLTLTIVLSRKSL